MYKTKIFAGLLPGVLLLTPLVMRGCMNREIKIGQLADDTTLFLNDIESIKHVMSFLGEFGEVSGLKLNASKTEAVWIGSNIGKIEKPLNLKWNDGDFKCLGIWCNTDTNKMIEKNYRERIDKLTTVLNIWRQRKLSLKGKITVLWSVALPQMLYVCSALYTPQWVVEEVDKLMFKFLWSSKAHVKKETIIAGIEQGGLKMIHFESMSKALKVIWIKRLKNMNSNCSTLASFLSGSKLPLSTLINCQLSEKHLKKCKSPFYKQILSYWYSIHTSAPKTAKQVFEQTLWYNSFILINLMPAFFKNWWNKGIIYVHQILNSNGTSKTKIELENKYEISIDDMDYNSLLHSIPKEWRKLLHKNPIHTAEINENIKLNINNKIIYLSKVRCKDIYLYFISKIVKPPTACNKWSEIYKIDPEMWQSIYKQPFHICQETELQTFQYKIINRFFPCNYTLSLWFKETSSLCHTCHTYVDTLQHYFVLCHDVTLFWTFFSRWWKGIFEFSIKLKETDILFGIPNPNNDMLIDVFNYCILFGKWFIFNAKQKAENVFFFNFLCELKNKLQVIETLYSLNDNLSAFELKWSLLYTNI